MSETKPKPGNIDPVRDKPYLLEGRYGTDDTIKIWGPDQTYQFSLDSQAHAVMTLSNLHPDIIPDTHAQSLYKAANLSVINPARIAEIEDKTGHDVIAINSAWGKPFPGNMLLISIKEGRALIQPRPRKLSRTRCQ